MKELDIKATIYDIFGYLLPGLIIMVIGIISYEHSNSVIGLGHINDLVNSLDGKKITLLFFIAYISGHALSSLSSIILEKNILLRFKVFSNLISLRKLLSEGLNNKLMEKFKNISSLNYTDKDFRFLVAYVESIQPTVYSTAFTYLAFYGMARTMAFVFYIGFGWEIFNILYLGYIQSITFAVMYFCLALIFSYHYFRFFRYFKEEIVYGFILPSS